MYKLYMLIWACFLLGFLYASPIKKNCGVCKDTGNCADELNSCEAGCDNTCRRCLISCVKKQDGKPDVKIGPSFNTFMERFKCCFQQLTACIRHANKKKENIKDYDAAIMTCSAQMMNCSKGSDSKQQYVRKAPPVLRALLLQYAKCNLQHVGKPWICVLNYHRDTEQLLGSDCLNKYVHCTQNYADSNSADVCPQPSGALTDCLSKWKGCMNLEKCSVGPGFLTPSIKDVWNKCGESTDVMVSIKCIVVTLIADGKKTLLYDQHIKAGCALAYCGDKNITSSYNACVNRSKDVSEEELNSSIEGLKPSNGRNN